MKVQSGTGPLSTVAYFVEKMGGNGCMERMLFCCFGNKWKFYVYLFVEYVCWKESFWMLINTRIFASIYIPTQWKALKESNYNPPTWNNQKLSKHWSTKRLHKAPFQINQKHHSGWLINKDIVTCPSRIQPKNTVTFCLSGCGRIFVRRSRKPMLDSLTLRKKKKNRWNCCESKSN